MMKRSVTNQEIARVLAEIGMYLDMEGVAFKPRAYEKAAQIIESLEEEVAELYSRDGVKGLQEIPGIGAGIANRIEEFIRTGVIKDHEKLKKRVPVDISGLSRVEGLGPKSIKKLYQALKIRNLDELERAALKHKISGIPGFGPKTEENILKGIEFLKRTGDRFLLGFMMPQIREIERRLHNLPGIDKVVVAGSVRRRKETIGDADILVTVAGKEIERTAKKVMDYFVSMPEVARVYAHGDTRSSVKLASGLDVDLRVVPKESYGAALNYFTGSKDHNVALRELAVKRGLKLNEYGLFRGKKQIAGKSEEELYRAFGMDYIEPEMREMKGEIELAKRHSLPDLIGYDELQGDLQVQTNWTDGSASIEEMAKAAMRAGLAYIAITDHTKRLAMTHGLDEKRIKKQWLEIDRVNKKLGGKLKVLKGTECDILKDGSLDLPDEILSKLDVVGVSVHSHFNLSSEDQTSRIIRAIENPHVDILFHPTGRILGKRDAYEVHMTEIIKAAKKTGTVLEIDSYPDRLDLRDEHIRMAVQAGVRLAIDSDAHSPEHFAYLEYGIAQARRGWARREDIINSWPLSRMLQFLKRSG